MDRKNRIVLATVILAVALACAPLLPQIAPLPTQQPGAVNTVVAGTRAAAIAQTQELLPPTFTPSVTRPPTNTPTITPTATATIIFRLPTLVPTKKATATKKPGSGGGGGGGGGTGGDDDDESRFQCNVVATVVKVNNVVVPGDRPSVPANTNFTITWTVRNIGRAPWDHNSVDYRYVTGTKFHQPGHPLYDFPDVPATVGVGQYVDLVVDNPPLLSPSNSGPHTAIWTLQVSNVTFCELKIAIKVP